MREGADAIGRIMGLEPEVAYETLVNSYGKDIADEVIGIGRIWTRRERSFVAVSSLVTLGSKDRLKLHLGAALNHGMTKEEIEEAILTLMIYAGHARATEAIDIAREVFRERGLL